MTRVGLFLIVMHCISDSYSQSGDSLATRFLDEVVFVDASFKGDTLQNYYRSNASATTETILSRMKGMALVRRGPFGQEPVFRSLSGGQLNITIDGMKIFGACTDKMDPVTIYVEPQNLSAMQVLAGTGGAAFGSTVGGSLDMKLADPKTGTPGLKGRAGLDYQTAANALTYFSKANLSRKKISFLLSITYRKSGEYRAGGGEEIPFSQYEKLNISTSAKLPLGKFDTLQANVLFDQGWNIGFAGLPMDVRKAVAGILSVNWKRSKQWLIFHNASVRLYHNRVSHTMDDWSRGNVPVHMDMPGESRTSGIFAEADVHVFHDHRTFVRMDYFVNGILGEMMMYPEEGPLMYMQTAPESRRQNAGLFVSQHLRLSDRSRASISFRADINRDAILHGPGYQQWRVFNPAMERASTKVAKTASVSFDSRVSGNIRLEFQAGIGERIPTLNERYGYYLFNRFDGFDYLGNPEIKNERSLNAEATMMLFGNKTELEVTPYYQRIPHFIFGGLAGYSSMTYNARGVKQYINLPWATLSGVDVLFMTTAGESVQWITNIKYTHGIDDKRVPLPLIPPLKAINSLKYKKAEFNVQIEWEWAGAQPRINPQSGEHPSAAWSVLSLRTGWRINSFLNCNGGIENLFDRNYREHLDIAGVPRPGRNIYLNVTYSF